MQLPSIKVLNDMPLMSHLTETKYLIIGLLGLIVIPLLYALVYAFVFSPTRHIPGPFLSRFGKLYLTRLAFKGTLSVEIYKLHQKYGTSFPLHHT